MAALQETVAVAKHGHGAVVATWTSGPTFRITKFEVEDLAGEWLAIEGGNVSQIVDFIESKKATGAVRLTTDEVLDVDATTVRGKQALITLGQPLPLASSKKWHMTAATALVTPQSMSGGRAGEQTMTQLTIRPYNATVGTAMWVFDNDTADA